MKVSASTLAEIYSMSTLGNEEEFVIHSQHTCVKCLQKPIVGKRYTSRFNANLCQRCFEKFPVTEIGLLMATASIDDKKISRDCVLKLKIVNGGDDQVRRMKVWQLWDNSSSNLSIEKLLSAAAGFTFRKNEMSDAAGESVIANTIITYLDEDGDTVNISSDDELKDAFMQVLATLPVCKPLVVKVTVPEVRMTYKRIQANHVGLSKNFVPASMKNAMKMSHSVTAVTESEVPEDVSEIHLPSARWIWWNI